MKTALPSVSVVIATFNSRNTIARCLTSIRQQTYPQSLISIIIVDGGSIDGTRDIVKNFHVKLISVNPKKQNAEYNKSIGIQEAKGEILFLLDHDNVLPHNRWLKRMVYPFLDSKKVVGVETLRYHYDPNGSLLDRYFSLFGAGDPIAYYLGKADRLSYLHDVYNLAGQAIDKGTYYLVEFNDKNIPTLGANGFLIRRKLLMEHARSGPGEYYHIDVNVDLIREGYNTYAFVKDSIIHLTGYNNIFNFLKRRILFLKQYYLDASGTIVKKSRRYSVFEKKDTFKLIKFIIISITLVIPLIDSIRGYRKIHDIAWFLHPFLCFVLFVLYSYTIMSDYIRRYVKQFLEK